MADERYEFAALMEQAIQGNQQAAVDVFEKYHKALIRVIRHRLKQFPQLRRLHDSDDFLQMVWMDALAQREKLGEFATFEGFHKFLAEVARHKVDNAWRDQTAQKRDLRRTHHLSDAEVAGTTAATADPRPNPAQDTDSHDAMESWLVSLPKRPRFVVLGLRAGCSYRELASELGCSVRTIKRIVAELRGISPPEPLPYL